MKICTTNQQRMGTCEHCHFAITLSEDWLEIPFFNHAGIPPGMYHLECYTQARKEVQNPSMTAFGQLLDSKQCESRPQVVHVDGHEGYTQARKEVQNAQREMPTVPTTASTR
jgi:glutaredoxin